MNVPFRAKRVSVFPRAIVAPVAAALMLMFPPVAAGGELDEPTALAMAGDLLIARPAGVVLTALGSVAFVVSLPFSAAGGNVGQAAEHLVIKPAKTTFVRCLGCTTAGYRRDTKDEKK
jgi:hypothetical protein